MLANILLKRFAFTLKASSVKKNKMNKIISNKAQFQKVSVDDNIANLSKFQRFLYNLKRKQFLKKEVYDRIRPISAITPTLYGLPKLHKEGHPCRPILASNGSYTYDCAVWLNEILTPLREHPSCIKDTFDFVSRLSKFNFSSSHMVSFDVISLFTNIPLDLVIDIVLQKIYSNKEMTLLHGLTKAQFKKLLTWTTKTTTFQFNKQYYKQTNGVAMRSPLAPLLADLCMNWIIDQTKQIRPQPTLFYRYVDDCFALFSSQKEILKFHQQLNMIHPNIQFTYEAAENHQMPFLDVWIDNFEGILKLSTYRKPTNTGLYINWQSFVPSRYKLSLVKTLLQRAHSICNLYSLIHEDFQGISSILQRNGYPLWYINKQIRLFLNKRHKSPIMQKYDTSSNCESLKTSESKEIPLFLRLPYLGHGLLNSNTWTGNAARTASASDQDKACISRRDCYLSLLEKESFE